MKKLSDAISRRVPMNDFIAAFAARLKEARGRAGLSQQALADNAGVTRETVCKWERGQKMPCGYNMVILADALNVSVGWLVAGEGKAHD